MSIKNQMLVNTPTNLKEINSINTLLDLFYKGLDVLEKYSSKPLDIYNSDYLTKEYNETNNTKIKDIKEELIKIKIQEIYETFSSVQDDKDIYNKFKKIYEALGLNTNDLVIKADINKAITSELISASNSYKSKKGTKSGFDFVYDIIKKTGIQAINSKGLFEIIEGYDINKMGILEIGSDNFYIGDGHIIGQKVQINKYNIPFYYTVKTSLYKEVFEKTIVPLAHPVGFVWYLIRILSFELVDYFSTINETILKEFYLTCYNTSGEVRTQEIVKSDVFGVFKKYYKNTNSENKTEIIIDYYPLSGSGNGYRFVRHYNNSNKLYDRQYYKDNKVNLEIQSVENKDDTQGDLEVHYKENGFVDYISFTENTIIDKETFSIKYKIHDADEENEAIIKFREKEVNPDNKKVFITQDFTAEEILTSDLSITSYNGKVIRDYGVNCSIDYLEDVIITNIVTDISDNIRNIRPINSTLAMDVRDIDISENDDIDSQYSNIDHTLEENDEVFNWDYWGRKDINNYRSCKKIGEFTIGDGTLIYDCCKNPRPIKIIGEYNLKIGGGWHISNCSGLHISDVGYNNVQERQENYYAPSVEEDMEEINLDSSYKDDYIEQNIGNEYYYAKDYIDFGVYRDGERLEDNNESALD